MNHPSPTFGLYGQDLQTNPSSFEGLVTRGVDRLRTAMGSIPPTSLVLFSCFAVQVGVALAKGLFDSLGSIGAALVCKGFAALFLLYLWRPRWRHHRWQDYLLISLLGLTIAGMSLAFYGAVDRIPLGIASTIEFIGPLTVALIGSRRWLDLLWIAMAGTGVVLLAPLGGMMFDPVGIGLALLSGAFWMAYILLAGPTGQAFPGGTGLALSMTIAAGVLLPAGIHQAGVALLDPKLLGLGICAGFIGTIVPYSLEYQALKTLPPRIFGVLMSIEPAIAALVGFLVLGEQLGWRSLLAVVLVTMAAIGVTWFGRGNSRH